MAGKFWQKISSLPQILTGKVLAVNFLATNVLRFVGLGEYA